MTEHIMDTGHSIKFISIHRLAEVKGYLFSVMKEAIEIQDSPEDQTCVYVYCKRGGFLFHRMLLFTDR